MKRRERVRITKPQVWQESDILDIVSNVEDYGLLIECAYYIGAGLRFSSAIMLKWDDFLWEDWLLDTSKMGKCDIHAKGNKNKNLMVNPILMNKLYNIAKNNGKLFQNTPYKNSCEDLFLFVDIESIEKLEDKYRKENFNNMLDNDSYMINITDRARYEIIRKAHYLVDYKLRKLASRMHKKSIKFHS